MNEPQETEQTTVIIETGCIRGLWRAKFCRITGVGDTKDEAIADMWEIVVRRLGGFDIHE